ncbi:MAG: cohesin domain-containing protein [Methanosarcinaceae archaeon]
MNKIVFGIILAVVMMFAVPLASAESTIYFDPDPSSAEPGETITVTLWLNTSEGVAAFNDDIHFDTEVLNITDATAGDFPIMWTVVHYGDFLRIGGWSPTYLDQDGLLKLGDLTFEAKDSGVSTLYHTGNAIGHWDGVVVNGTWINSSFACGDVQTFTKDLLEGWNLISLPLAPTDNSTSAVLSGVTYNAVSQYNADTNLFEDATVMDPGIGYFVYVTTASTWEYPGDSVSSTSVQLETGLNMIGVPDCTMSVSDAMGSTEYRYITRWDAATQEYKVYNPTAPEAFHGFTMIEAGEGYFVSSLSDGMLAITPS